MFMITRPGVNADGVIVTVSEDETSSTIKVPKDVADQLNMSDLSLHAGLWSEFNQYCRRQVVKVPLPGTSNCSLCNKNNYCSNSHLRFNKNYTYCQCFLKT